MIMTLVVWCKRLLVLALFFVFLIFFVNFTLTNTQMIGLDFIGFTLPELKVSTLVVVPFLLGGLLGLTVASFVIARLRLGNASLRRNLARRDAELQKLRTNTLKGLTDA